MSTTWLFIEPVDLLHFRGNALFGAPGSLGTVRMPPWPSTLAGALRSALLVDLGIDPAGWARGDSVSSEVLACLGRPAAPGSFSVREVRLGRAGDEGIEPLFPAPADLVIEQVTGSTGAVPAVTARRMRPAAPPPGLRSGSTLPCLSVLQTDARSKAASGTWYLDMTGWRAWLEGEVPGPQHLLDAAGLWSLEERIGVGLESASRSVAEGRLFTSQAVRLAPSIGFLVGVKGVDGLLRESGWLRLGGDGRGARWRRVPPPDADSLGPEAVGEDGVFRVVLRTPAMFAGGWSPAAGPDHRWSQHGLGLRVCAAVVPGHEVVSGWDMAARAPKPAVRVAPAGSVYWIELESGEPAQLGKLAADWIHPGADYDGFVNRRAEGYNRIALARS